MRQARVYPPGVRVIDGYPIPAGGNGAGDGQAGGTDGGTGGTGDASSSTDGQAGTATGQDDTGGTGDDTDEAGELVQVDGKDVVLPADHPLVATMRSEREKRKAAEKRARELEQSNEGETEAREREIREQAQAPAVRALRATAVEMAAAKAGFLYPGDVYALLTTEERDAIDVDLDDEIPSANRVEADRVVKALAKRRPGLITTSDGGDDGDGGQARGGSDNQAGGRSTGDGNSTRDPNATLRGLLRQKLGTPG